MGKKNRNKGRGETAPIVHVDSAGFIPESNEEADVAQVFEAAHGEPPAEDAVTHVEETGVMVEVDGRASEPEPQLTEEQQAKKDSELKLYFRKNELANPISSFLEQHSFNIVAVNKAIRGLIQDKRPQVQIDVSPCGDYRDGSRPLQAILALSARGFVCDIESKIDVREEKDGVVKRCSIITNLLVKRGDFTPEIDPVFVNLDPFYTSNNPELDDNDKFEAAYAELYNIANAWLGQKTVVVP